MPCVLLQDNSKLRGQFYWAERCRSEAAVVRDIWVSPPKHLAPFELVIVGARTGISRGREPRRATRIHSSVKHLAVRESRPSCISPKGSSLYLASPSTQCTRILKASGLFSESTMSAEGAWMPLNMSPSILSTSSTYSDHGGANVCLACGVLHTWDHVVST